MYVWRSLHISDEDKNKGELYEEKNKVKMHTSIASGLGVFHRKY